MFMYTSRVMNSHILDPIDFMGVADSSGNYKTNKNIKISDVIKTFQNDRKASIQIGQMPEYTIFFKMLKMGIPKDAIKQKMKLLNLDVRFIDYPDSTLFITVMHYISNPHLGPFIKSSNISSLSSLSSNISSLSVSSNISSSNILSSNISSLSVSSNISSSILPLHSTNLQLDLLKNISLGSFKLKKTEKCETNEVTRIDKIIGSIRNKHGGVVPSLQDIQDSLSRLKNRM